MKRILFCSALAALGFVFFAAVLVLYAHMHRSEPESSAAIRVTSSIDHSFILYADEFNLTVNVEVDTDYVNPDSVEVLLNLEDFSVKGYQRELFRNGNVSTVTERYTLQCFACVPKDSKYVFNAGIVSYRDTQGVAGTTYFNGESFTVASRLTTAEMLWIVFRPYVPVPPPVAFSPWLVWGSRFTAAVLSFVSMYVLARVLFQLVRAKGPAADKWSLFVQKIQSQKTSALSAESLADLRVIAGSCRLLASQHRTDFPEGVLPDQFIDAYEVVAFGRLETSGVSGDGVENIRRKLCVLCDRIIAIPVPPVKKGALR